MNKVLTNLIPLWFSVTTVYALFAYYSPVPYWDMWNGYLEFYLKVLHGDFSVWFAQHNEHKILISRLLFFVDHYFFDGSLVFLIIMNGLLMGLITITHLSLAQKLFNKESLNYKIMAALLFAFSFSWVQKENITWGFQSQFFLAYVLPYLTFFTMVAFSQKRANIWFIFSLLLGMLSTFTMANGVLTLPILFLLTIVLRLSYYRIALVFLIALSTDWLYFYDYRSVVGHGSLMEILIEHPLDFVSYFLGYLGSLFYYLAGKGSVWPAYLGGVTLIVTAIFITLIQFFSSKKTPYYWVIIAFLLYYGATAFGTTGGRANFGVGQAFSSRYMTPNLMAWGVIAIFYLHYFRSNISISKGLKYAYVAILIIVSVNQFTIFKPLHDTAENKKLASLALEMGVRDEHYIRQIFPFVDWVRDMAESIRKENLSIFHENAIIDTHEAIGTTITLPIANFIGHLDEVQPIEQDQNYLRIRGWVYDSSSHTVPKGCFVVNQQGIIVGAVVTGFEREDVRKAISYYARRSGFTGYIQSSERTSTLFLVDRNKSIKLNIGDIHDKFN